MPDQPSVVDLNTLVQQSGQLTFKTESLEERSARLEQAAKDADFARWKQKQTFLAVLIAASIMTGLCVFLIITRDDKSDVSKWAMNIVTAIFTALLGYAFGKADAGKPSG